MLWQSLQHLRKQVHHGALVSETDLGFRMAIKGTTTIYMLTTIAGLDIIHNRFIIANRFMFPVRNTTECRRLAFINRFIGIIAALLSLLTSAVAIALLFLVLGNNFMKYIVLALLATLTLALSGCGTIGGTLSGMGSDMKIAGEWCSDLGK